MFKCGASIHASRTKGTSSSDMGFFGVRFVFVLKKSKHVRNCNSIFLVVDVNVNVTFASIWLFD